MERRDHFICLVGDGTLGDAGGTCENQRDTVIGFTVVNHLGIHGAGDDAFDAQTETFALFVEIFHILTAGCTRNRSQDRGLDALSKGLAAHHIAFVLTIGGRRVGGCRVGGCDRWRCGSGITTVDFETH